MFLNTFERTQIVEFSWENFIAFDNKLMRIYCVRAESKLTTSSFLIGVYLMVMFLI